MTTPTVSSSLLVSPHERLPTEVMSKVLIEACHETGYGLRIQHRIHTLSTVCKAWRSIVLSTPELYPKYVLKITNPHISQEDLVEMVRRAREWFDRSAGLPCDLNVQITAKLKFADLASEVNPLLEGVRERLRAFQLKGPHRELNSVLAGLPQDLPSLETVYLRRITNDRDDNPITPSFANCTNLKSVSLYNLDDDGFDYRDCFPYAQLTSLTIAAWLIDPETVQHILSSAINLVECRIVQRFPWYNTPMFHSPDPASQETTVIHQSLRTFHFTSSIPGIFDTLHLPALTELDISPSDSTIIRFPEKLVELYHRAPFQLETLKIHNCTLTGREFVRFLKLVPSLRVLHLPDCYSGGGRFLDVLTIPNSTNSSDNGDHTLVLPNIEYLDMVIGIDEGEVDSLINFVESRLSPAYKPFLRRLTLSDWEIEIPAGRKEDWEARGLRFRLDNQRVD